MDTINMTWLIIGIIAGVGIGYAITVGRLNLFLRRNYPFVDFHTPIPKELHMPMAQAIKKILNEYKPVVEESKKPTQENG